MLGFILYDRTFAQSQDTAIQVSDLSIINVKMNLKMTWGTSSGTNITSNGLYMLTICETTGGTNLPDVEYTMRLWFNDM